MEENIERPDAVADAELDANVAGYEIACALKRHPPELRAVWLAAFSRQVLVCLQHMGYAEVFKDASALTETDIYGNRDNIKP